MSNRSILVLVALFSFPLTLSCASTSDHVEQIGSAEWAIVGGTPTDMEERATVVVMDERSGGLCSGSLIAPRVVLTAKHCVQQDGLEGRVQPESLLIGFGDDTLALSQTIHAASIWTTPGVYADIEQLAGRDIALITLRSAPEGITPLSLFRGDPQSQARMWLRAVGYGLTPYGIFGVKYQTVTQILHIEDSLITTQRATCGGDSGGPLINDADEIVGVLSMGTPGCYRSGYDYYNVIDVYIDDIDRVIRATGECPGVREETCNGLDDDCDGEVDEDCQDLGEPCDSDAQCVSLTCEVTEGGQLCTTACEPLSPHLGCPSGLYCARTSDCEGRCELGTVGESGFGESCDSDTDCASLHCATVVGENQCLAPCVGGLGTCFAGEVCGAPELGCGACVPGNTFGETRGAGEDCEDDSDCDSGICFTDLGRSYCSTECAGDLGCLTGFHCRIDENRCVRGPRSGLGQRCGHDHDCERGAYCGEDQYCSHQCELGSDDCGISGTCEVESDGANDGASCMPELVTLGNGCQEGSDCLSSLCEPLGQTGQRLCTSLCGSGLTCETGTYCVRQQDGSGRCVPPDMESPPEPEGCSISHAQQSPPMIFVFLLMSFFYRRRKAQAFVSEWKSRSAQSDTASTILAASQS